MKSKMCKYVFALISFLILFCGCGTKFKKGQEQITINRVDSLNEIRKQVLRGDTNSYYSLRVAYLDNDINGLLPWAVLMANKYNYSPACYDVYYLLMTSRNLELYQLDSLDDKTKNLALYYLLMAAKVHEPNAMNAIKELKASGIDHFPDFAIDFPIDSNIKFHLK